MTSRVLIVDDDPQVVELLSSYLEDSVDEVRGISDSRLVEHTFNEFAPDIVILDLHMPQPDGFELLRRLRGVRQSLGFLPVIVITGDTGHVARNSALILGADEFLVKPIDRDELVLRVRNLLRTRQLFIEARELPPD